MRSGIRRRALGMAMVMAAVLPLLVVASRPAAACTCIDSPLPDRLAQADAGFRGTVVGRRDLPAPQPDPAGGAAEWTFAVDEVLKGPVSTPRQEIRSGLNTAACGIEFQIGQRYLVLAHFDGDVLSTGLCSAMLIGDAPPVPTTAPTSTTVPTPDRATRARVDFTG